MESRLHELLKEAALTELAREGYYLYVEPSDPPSWRLNWSLYRPDIAGTLTNELEFWFVLVECETNPNTRRIRRKISKIRRSLTLQNRLNETYLFRLLLVIPAGMLERVNCSEVRLRWEIWIASYRGSIIHKIPRKGYPSAS